MTHDVLRAAFLSEARGIACFLNPSGFWRLPLSLILSLLTQQRLRLHRPIWITPHQIPGSPSLTCHSHKGPFAVCCGEPVTCWKHAIQCGGDQMGGALASREQCLVLSSVWSRLYGNVFSPIMVSSQELRSTSLHLSPFASLWLGITLLGDLSKACAMLFGHSTSKIIN